MRVLFVFLLSALMIGSPAFAAANRCRCAGHGSAAACCAAMPAPERTCRCGDDCDCDRTELDRATVPALDKTTPGDDAPATMLVARPPVRHAGRAPLVNDVAAECPEARPRVSRPLLS